MVQTQWEADKASRQAGYLSEGGYLRNSYGHQPEQSKQLNQLTLRFSSIYAGINTYLE